MGASKTLLATGLPKDTTVAEVWMTVAQNSAILPRPIKVTVKEAENGTSIAILEFFNPSEAKAFKLGLNGKFLISQKNLRYEGTSTIEPRTSITLEDDNDEVHII